MTSLKRAINHRLKTLESEYGFSTLPTSLAKKQTLETLRDFGLVRPTLLGELMKVRNDIEHKDAPPPDLRTCQLYVDVVWYFLKSTDQLVELVLTDLVYEDFETNSVLTLDFHTSGEWRVKIDGLVRTNLLREDNIDDGIEIVDFKSSPHRNGQSVKFGGSIRLTPEVHLRLVNDYFGCQGYEHEDGVA